MEGMNSHQQYIDLYRAHRNLLDGGSCSVLNACREEAARLLSAPGLPAPRDEHYKYTDT